MSAPPLDLHQAAMEMITIRRPRLYKIPRSTLSAMIHQDRERAGLSLTLMNVMYANLTCTHLTKALHDKDPLGSVTHPKRLLQNDIFAELL